MRLKRIALAAVAAAMLATMPACSHKVERVSVEETIDLSGNWNDTDSRQVAEAMVEQVLQGGWISEYNRTHMNKKPVVIVGLVYNKSSEHIESLTFIKDIEKAFINSGRVRIVQCDEKREALRQERAQQQNYASVETAKQWGKELGADFMLQGDITSIVDQYKSEKVKYYQTSLELSDLESNEVVWIGDKKIKKYIKN